MDRIIFSPPNLSELQKKLEIFSAMVKVSCRWKVAGELLLPDPDLPECTGYHRNAFCARVKTVPGGEARCIRNDSRELAGRLRHARQGFLQECHAGAVEIIVPIIDSGGRPIGAVMAGPFRRRDGICRCAAAAAEFEKLPLLDDDQSAGYFEFIPQLFAPTVERAYREPTGTLHRLPRDPRLQKILELLRHTPTLPVQDLATAVELSPSRLFHLFREECETGLGNYMLLLRLQLARRYLLAGSWPLNRIALHTGFSDQSHFTMSFRKYFGAPPLKYRKLMRARTAACQPEEALPLKTPAAGQEERNRPDHAPQECPSPWP